MPPKRGTLKAGTKMRKPMTEEQKTKISLKLRARWSEPFRREKWLTSIKTNNKKKRIVFDDGMVEAFNEMCSRVPAATITEIAVRLGVGKNAIINYMKANALTKPSALKGRTKYPASVGFAVTCVPPKGWAKAPAAKAT